jgi:hypothetical protein
VSLIHGLHRLGAAQVGNVPGCVETVMLPAGSCTAAASVLFGIAEHRPAGLKRVILFGIGPNRLRFLEERLALLERASGLAVRHLFRRDYAHDRASQELYQQGGDPPYTLGFYDLHASGFTTYQDEVPAEYGGVELHPTYEGKVMSYVLSRPDLFGGLMNPTTLFWVIGGKPRFDAIRGALGGPGRPETLEVYP